MSITKSTDVDQITIAENNAVFYREATSLIEDGKVLTQTYNRTSLMPGQDLTGHPAKVIAVCNAVWTPMVVKPVDGSHTDVVVTADD